MSTEENKALIRHEYEDGVNKQNLNIADEVFAPDYVGHLPGLPPVQGLDAYKQVASGFYTAFPDLQTTVEDLIAEGDKVAVRHSWRGTHKRDFQGIPPTGKQVTFTSMDIYRIVGGKIAEEWIEIDMLGLLQQLGVIPPMG